MKSLPRGGTIATALFVVLAGLGLGIAPALNTNTDTADDVRKEFNAHVAALQSGDVEGYLQRHHPQNSTFDLGGGILREYGSRDEQRPGAQAAVDSGVFESFQVRDVHIKTFGDDAALLTFYLVMDAGTPGAHWSRRSELWVKEGGRWMEAHGHWSDL